MSLLKYEFRKIHEINLLFSYTKGAFQKLRYVCVNGNRNTFLDPVNFLRNFNQKHLIAFLIDFHSQKKKKKRYVSYFSVFCEFRSLKGSDNRGATSIPSTGSWFLILFSNKRNRTLAAMVDSKLGQKIYKNDEH